VERASLPAILVRRAHPTTLSHIPDPLPNTLRYREHRLPGWADAG